ncbi:MAG: DUF255 domain-containing protein [Luteolibacter sp.]
MFSWPKWMIAILLSSCSAPAADEPTSIAWRRFDAATIAKARDEKKLLFLDLEAVWCHWCHVMDEKTYTDPGVRAALAKDFICMKVDQDSRPDLAKRYEDYGWPALVVIDPVTLQDRAIGSGFQRPAQFLKLLEKGKDPQAKAESGVIAGQPGGIALSDAQRTVLMSKLRDRYDAKEKGWGSGDKFVPWENVEFCIRLARTGDTKAQAMAEETLAASTALIDPQWGGLYQYSTDGDWKHPHFEKIMEFESEVLRVYALAHLAWDRPRDLDAAKQIAKHLHDFLRSPDGAFYVSQDADLVPGEHSAGFYKLDDAGRRKLGIPKVDRHVYSRENGLAIHALIALWQASTDPVYLAEAKQAAEWIVQHRTLSGGGFSHDETDAYGPFLGDQVQMGRALLALYLATADAKWLERSIQCADFTEARFKSKGGGYLASVPRADAPAPVMDRNENIAVVRWCNLLARTSGETRFSDIAKHGMRHLSSEAVLVEIFSFSGGVMLADRELTEEPVHISIVGIKEDASAYELFATAQRHPSSYKIIEWITPGAPVKKGGIEYPDFGKAAAFLCADGRCSSPKFKPEDLAATFSLHAKSN